MEELNFVVPIGDFSLVRAVVSLCPNLKKIGFRGEFDSKSILHSLSNDECSTSPEENTLPQYQLVSILRGLSKVYMKVLKICKRFENFKHDFL